MRLFELGRGPPRLSFIGEDADDVRSNRSRRLKVATSATTFCVVHPSLEPLVFFNIDVERRFDDSPRRSWAAFALASFRFLQPSLSVHHHLLIPERRDSLGHDPIDHRDVSRLLRQSRGGDPNLVRRRNRLSGFVENFLRSLGRFESSERQPEIDGRWNEFDGSREKHSSVGRVCFKIDRLFPEGDRVRDCLKSCLTWRGIKSECMWITSWGEG